MAASAVAADEIPLEYIVMLGNQSPSPFPSVYSNETQSDADAAAQCGYTLSNDMFYFR